MFFVSCNEGKDKAVFVPANFQVDSSTVKLNYTTREIIQFKDGYLCRVFTYDEDSMDLIYLNKQFELQYDFSLKLNKGLDKGIHAIWTSKDTLFAIQGYGNYKVCYWLNNTWKIKDSGSMTKENYMHQQQNYPIFEDEKYSVSSCCTGEFGGAIYFKDKSSQKIYSCQSTCLVGVYKMDGSYYVSSSLAHGSSRSKIIRIDNPSALYEIKTEKELKDCSWYDIYSENPKEFEIKHPKGFDKGFEVLLDTFEVLIVGSFNYENQQYHIYSDKNKTYLAQLKMGKLTPIKTIYNKAMWLTEVRDLKHNATIYPINCKEMSGIILRKGNKLKIVEFIDE